MNWIEYPPTANCAALSCSDDYVISHRKECFTVSFRPPGRHIHVGQFTALVEAKCAAEAHHATPNAKLSNSAEESP